MKEELLKLEDVENMVEEELQYLDSMELEEQIKFWEPTIIVTNQDADFYVRGAKGCSFLKVQEISYNFLNQLN